MTTPTLREAARAICRVQYNGGDPDQPAVRWNGTEMEPQEFPAWEDFLDEARAVIAALAQPDEAERCPICSGHKGFFEGELWTPCVNCDGTGEKPCPDCAEMAKQRDHYREQSRANSSGQLAEELSCALARIERLELALEAWEETYSPCEHDPNYPSWCLTHHTKGCNVEEARRLTEEARK